MRIGIDALLIAKPLTGIGIYLKDMIHYLQIYDTHNEYFLYANNKIVIELNLSDRWNVRESNVENSFLWQICELPKLVKKDGIDLFFEPGNRMPVLPNNIPLVVTVHDLGSYLYPQYCSWQTYVMERLFLKRTCKRATYIVTISEFTKDTIVDHLKIRDEKIKVIYNGDTPYKGERVYSSKALSDIKEKFQINGKYFLFIGSISPRKNIEVIIRGYELYRENGGETQLVLAGKVAWRCDDIMENIQTSKFSKDIIVTGYIDEKEKEYLYKYSEGLIFPSRFEGFGFPILEAMSVGTRVITSNYSSMPEVAGNAALYLKNIDDCKELSELMHKLDTMGVEEKAEMVSAGYERVKLFSREKCAIQLLSLFNACK